MCRASLRVVSSERASRWIQIVRVCGLIMVMETWKVSALQETQDTRKIQLPSPDWHSATSCLKVLTGKYVLQ